MVINRNKMYNQFKEIMNSFLVFSTKDILKYFPNFDKKNLVNWQKKGYIIKIRNNFYCFSDTTINEEFLYLVANTIYQPSYLSFETALSYYNIIPEGVYILTSATTTKTNEFSTPIANFSYRNFKSNLFFGYRLITYKNQYFKMASLEKTVLDYLYLNSQINEIDDFDLLRWNKEELKLLDIDLFNSYLNLFNSNKLNKRAKNFLNYIYA